MKMTLSRGAEGAARARRLPERARGSGRRVLRLERRDLPAAQRHVGGLLRERGVAADRRRQCLHQARPRLTTSASSTSSSSARSACSARPAAAAPTSRHAIRNGWRTRRTPTPRSMSSGSGAAPRIRSTPVRRRSTPSSPRRRSATPIWTAPADTCGRCGPIVPPEVAIGAKAVHAASGVGVSPRRTENARPVSRRDLRRPRQRAPVRGGPRVNHARQECRGGGVRSHANPVDGQGPVIRREVECQPLLDQT